MNWKFHQGYGAFLFGLIGVSVIVAACAQEGPERGTPCLPTDPSCVADATGVGGVGGQIFSGGAGGAITTGPADAGQQDGGYDPSDAGAGDGGAAGMSPVEVDAGPPPIPPTCDGLKMDPHVFWISADDSNSMGSPAHAREMLTLGFEPSPSRIRTYEFLNYYQIAYDPPVAPDPLSIIPHMERTKVPEIAEFQFAIRSFDNTQSRRAANFTFLIDTSGSMKGPGMERAKKAISMIASQLKKDDIVSVLTTDMMDPIKIEGYKVQLPSDPAVLNVVDGLTTGGMTDLSTALSTAYKTAKSHPNPGGVQRVILLSDGGVNVGESDSNLIATQSADGLSDGFYLVGIGTGPALTYNDKLMNDVTDAGRGAYVYLDSIAEADRIFSKRFDEVMEVAARAVQIEVTVPWYFKFEAKAAEQLGKGVPVEPQNLAPNDAMVNFLQMEACDPGVYNWNDSIGIRVFWKTRTSNDIEVMQKSVPIKTLLAAGASPQMARARAIVAFADALKQCGYDKNGFSLCTSEVERQKTVKEKLLLALDLAGKAKTLPMDEDMDEIINLIKNHPLMQ